MLFMVLICAVSAGHLENLFQNIFHGADSGKCRLDKIYPHKGCKQKPIGRNQPGQNKGDKNNTAGNGADIMFHFHDNFSFTDNLYN